MRADCVACARVAARIASVGVVVIAGAVRGTACRTRFVHTGGTAGPGIIAVITCKSIVVGTLGIL